MPGREHGTGKDTTDFKGNGRMEWCGTGTGLTATAAGSRGKFQNGTGGRPPSVLRPVAAPTSHEATVGL